MNLSQWNKKGWPFLNDLELEEIVNFRLPQSRQEMMISDPEFIASYYFIPNFYIIFPSWHGLRRYNYFFFTSIRRFLSEHGVVDDIGVLLEKNSGDLLYKFDNEIIRIKPYKDNKALEKIRNILNLDYSKPKLVDSRMLSVWKSKISGIKSKKELVSFPAHPEFKATKEYVAKAINNIKVSLNILETKKFQVSWVNDNKLLRLDMGPYRMIIKCL